MCCISMLFNRQLGMLMLSVFSIVSALAGCSLKEIQQQTQEVANVGYMDFREIGSGLTYGCLGYAKHP